MIGHEDRMDLIGHDLIRHEAFGHDLAFRAINIIPILCLMLAGLRLYSEPLKLSIPRWPAMWSGTEPLGLPRAHVLAELEGYPGLQLAIVRYAPEHAPFDDWVYNAADIDKSRVVWAREMETRDSPELLRYFRDRRVWLVQPDSDPPKITPYPPQREIVVSGGVM